MESSFCEFLHSQRVWSSKTRIKTSSCVGDSALAAESESMVQQDKGLAIREKHIASGKNRLLLCDKLAENFECIELMHIFAINKP